MTPQENNLNTTSQESSLSSLVLSRIENEHLTPSARWHFLCKHYAVWLFWVLSIILGAVSVAVMLYVANHARFALYEATHETQLSFFIEVLPYVWIFVFGVMAVVAYFNLRHTRHGYRYSVWQVLLSSIALSLTGGVVLQVFGMGILIDAALGRDMPMYPSVERMEMRMWQMPDEGRLVGVFNGMDETETQYLLLDASNEEWRVEAAELRDVDKRLLSSKSRVRIIGKATDLENRAFYACGVFPWVFDKKVSSKALRAEREVFIDRMLRFTEDVDESVTEMKCAGMANIRRMHLISR